MAAIYAAGLISGAAVSAGAVSAHYPFERLEVFAEALSIIHARYVDELDADELVYDAVSGLCRDLDDHSIFMDPAAYQEMREETSGQYFGIGVALELRDGRLFVKLAIEGSPADEAGLLAGDEITAVDGEEVGSLGPEVALARIEGKRGSRVMLRIVRAGLSEPFDLAVRRDQVRTNSVEAAHLGGGIGWLRIERFQQRTVEEVRRALDGLAAAGPPLRGLVLDLRGNPGGYLGQAVAVADLWLPEGVIVSTVDRVEGPQHDSAHAQGSDITTNLVVLVDGSTASAAEIVAGALQDRQRAKVFGKTSYGKGSVQQFFELSDGSALKLTTARYYTPSGGSIQGVGVRPNVLFEQDLSVAARSSLDRLLLGHPSAPPWLDGDEILRMAVLSLYAPLGFETWWASVSVGAARDE